MSAEIPSGHKGAATTAFFLGCFVAPFIGYLVFFSSIFSDIILTFNLPYYRHFFSWRNTFGLLIGAYIFGLLPAAFSSLVCALYLYHRRQPSVLIATLSTLPFCLLVFGISQASASQGVRRLSRLLTDLAYLFGFCFLVAAITWLIVWWIMKRIYVKHDPLHS